MSTTKDYNLSDMLPGVLNSAIDAAGCRWCMRNTQDPIAGHDGYCPVPALFTMNSLRSPAATVTGWRPDLEAIEARTKLIPKIGYLVVELRGEDFPLDDGSAIQGETVAEAIVDLARADVPALIAEIRRLTPPALATGPTRLDYIEAVHSVLMAETDTLRGEAYEHGYSDAIRRAIAAIKELPASDTTALTDAMRAAWKELERYKANMKYYDSGYCGGCETCGNPPYPEADEPDYLMSALTKMEQALAAVRGAGGEGEKR